ncbi:hypothetical protein J4402_01155 [Candidatus Pacearchaeota archaeon]|nr:hypothetical protein [Candidatus Pacearchaeota archaeon]
MKKEIYYEKYPRQIVLFSNIVSIAIYLIGAFIIYQLGIIWLILYLAYIILLELRLIKGHCTDCYYYGKRCAFGKGKISSAFFKKGKSENFCKKKITWKSLIPDLMVSLIPFVVGIVLLIKNFNWIFLLSVIALFVLTSIGNGIIRSRLACKYCKQKQIGCPAQKLFEKKN